MKLSINYYLKSLLFYNDSLIRWLGNISTKLLWQRCLTTGFLQRSKATVAAASVKPFQYQNVMESEKPDSTPYKKVDR